MTSITWRKSTRSGSNGQCVEVGDGLPQKVLVRDSKDQAGPVLAFTHEQWRAFVDGVKRGEFNL